MPRVSQPLLLCAFAAPWECLPIAISDICTSLQPQGPVNGQVSRGQTGIPLIISSVVSPDLLEAPR